MIWLRGRRSRHLLLLGGALAAAGALLHTDTLWRLNTLIYDHVLGPRLTTAPPDVLVVGVDDHSLSQLGRWPWPRATHAALLDVLTDAGARAVVFDIAFNDAGRADDDERLARAVRRNGRVVLPVLFEQGHAGAPVESLPIPSLAAAAAALGHVDVETDPSGTARAVYLRAGVGSAHWPALALAADRVRRGQPPSVERAGTPSTLAWTREDRILLPLSAGPGAFRTVSFVDLLRKRVPVEQVAGATVFVGATAVGLSDRISAAAPGSGVHVPGVELVASAFDELRSGRPVRFLGVAATFSITTLLLIGIVSAAWTRGAGFLVAALAPLAVSWLLLHGLGLWFTPAEAMLVSSAGVGMRQWLRRRAQTHAHSLASAALGSVEEAVLTLDAEGLVEYMNHVAESWSGLREDEARGLPLSAVLRFVDPDLHPVPFASLARAGHIDGVVVGRTGVRRRVHGAAVQNGGTAGSSHGLVLALADGPETETEQAFHDPLTSLPNLTLVREHLAQLLRDAGASGRRGVVLVLDVERLRDVNVALGREAGDAILTTIAQRLRRLVSGRGLAGRLHGGEFGVIYDDLRLEEDPWTLGVQLVDALSDRTRADVRISVRAGACTFPQDGADADMLLQRADTAMREDATSGDRGVRVYRGHMSQTARDRLVLTRALERAIEERRIALVYQPIVDLMTGRLVAVEALARWRDDSLGVIPPSTFVPLAEETGLIDAFGDWTIAEACRQAKAWDEAGLPPFTVSVNVSPRQFHHDGFPAAVRARVTEAGLRPSRLMLEVTEGAMHDVERAVATLDELRRLGVIVALDDFGVGYSSLSHLRHLPVDVVKIDRSFVTGTETDGPDRTICLAMLSLAESLQRRVVAEGVETASQAEFLRSKGCRQVQGFYSGPPCPPDQIGALMSSGPLVAASLAARAGA